MESQKSPEEVARFLIGAQNAHDVDAAVGSFAEGAVVTLPTGVLNTPEAIRGWQDDLAAGNFHIDAGEMEINGNRVGWTGTVSLDRFTAMGIDTLGGVWKLEIADGKIKDFHFDWTPDGAQKLQAAIARLSS